MAKIDPMLKEILGKYHDNPEAALWNCHGTMVAYHKDLELIASKAGITFDPPHIIEANGHEGIAAICVIGHMHDRTEWSIGEAAPGNNKNAYPWAMAEKRAKDRVIIKLIGLSGFVYSEEEADDFKPKGPRVDGRDHEDGGEASRKDSEYLAGNWVNARIEEVAECRTENDLDDLWAKHETALKKLKSNHEHLHSKLVDTVERQRNRIKESA